MLETSDVYTGAVLDPTLNTKLVDEVAARPGDAPQYLRYTADGEPLLHPDIHDLLADAAARSGVTVTLTTNGTLLDEAAAERLLATGVHAVDFSIDAFEDETYARIRRRGRLPVTRANVLRFLEGAHRRTPPAKVVVSFVKQPDNESEADAFRAFWEAAGVDYVVIRRLHSNAGLTDAPEPDASLPQRRPCVYPWERIVLTPGGMLSYCPAGWLGQCIIADFRETTVREAWTGQAYRRLRAAHLAGDYPAFPHCGQCADWAQTRWPEEGRAYADMIEDFRREEQS
jgi:hypothetical protein